MSVEAFEAWMLIDENIETPTMLTDVDICEAVCKDQASIPDSDDDDEPKSLVGKKNPMPDMIRELS